jgi:hypothetical protein
MATTQPPGPLDKKAIEIMNVVDACRRAMIDLTVEEKRLVLTEVDKWVSYEESGHAQAAGQRH